MSDACKYENRIENERNALNLYFSDDSLTSKHRESCRYLEMFELWTDVLVDRPESKVFLLALDELENSFHHIVVGNYREAHSSLRLFLELEMVGIKFSVDELSLRKWHLDEFHIRWSSLLAENDKDNHEISKNFVRIFNQDMSGRWLQYKTLACSIHRDLSMHVHGAASTTSRAIVKLHDNEVLHKWHQHIYGVTVVVQYIKIARYAVYLKENTVAMPKQLFKLLKDLFAEVDDVLPCLDELEMLSV